MCANRHPLIIVMTLLTENGFVWLYMLCTHLFWLV